MFIDSVLHGFSSLIFIEGKSGKPCHFLKPGEELASP